MVNTLKGDVHKKLSSIGTIRYAVGMQRMFGTIKTKEDMERRVTSTPNRCQQEIQGLIKN